QAVGEQLAVACTSERDLNLLGAPVAEREHVLASRLGPADRAAEAARQPDDEDVFESEASLRPEAAADVGRYNPHVFLCEAERLGQRVAGGVGDLCREPCGQRASVPRGRTGAWLERAGGEPLAGDPAGGHDITAVEEL